MSQNQKRRKVLHAKVSARILSPEPMIFLIIVTELCEKSQYADHRLSEQKESQCFGKYNHKLIFDLKYVFDITTVSLRPDPKILTLNILNLIYLKFRLGVQTKYWFIFHFHSYWIIVAIATHTGFVGCNIWIPTKSIIQQRNSLLPVLFSFFFFCKMIKGEYILLLFYRKQIGILKLM